jgi:hypothetical protein
MDLATSELAIQLVFLMDATRWAVAKDVQLGLDALYDAFPAHLVPLVVPYALLDAKALFPVRWMQTLGSARAMTKYYETYCKRHKPSRIWALKDETI